MEDSVKVFKKLIKIKFLFLLIGSLNSFAMNVRPIDPACRDLMDSYELYSQIENTLGVNVSGRLLDQLIELQASDHFQSFVQANESIQYNFPPNRTHSMTLGKLKVMYVYLENFRPNDSLLSKIQRKIQDFGNEGSFLRMQKLKSSLIGIYQRDVRCNIAGEAPQEAFTGPLTAPNSTLSQRNACTYTEPAFWNSQNLTLLEDTDRIFSVVNHVHHSMAEIGPEDRYEIFTNDCQGLVENQQLRYLTGQANTITNARATHLIARHCNYVGIQRNYHQNVAPQLQLAFEEANYFQPMSNWDAFKGALFQAAPQAVGMVAQHFAYDRPRVDYLTQVAYARQDMIHQQRNFNYTNCIDAFDGSFDAARAISNTTTPTTNVLDWDWSGDFNCDPRVLRSNLNNFSNTIMAVENYYNYQQNPLYLAPGLAPVNSLFSPMFTPYTSFSPRAI